MSKPKKLLPYTVEPGEKIKLKNIPTSVSDSGYNKKSACKKIAKNAVVMADLAKKLYAENKRSILLVLQGMDTAGKVTDLLLCD